MPHKTENSLTSDQWIQIIEISIPLLSNLVWATLIFLLFFVVRKRLMGILDSILKRLNHGSAFNTPWFGMPDFIQPQTVEDKEKKSKEEQDEVEEPDVRTSSKPVSMRQNYYQAETQAIKTLEERFGQPIDREMKVHDLFLADGVFIDRGRLHIIEVKMVKDRAHPRLATKFLSNARRLSRQALAETVLHLVIVHTDEIQNRDEFISRLRKDAQGLPLEIEFQKFASIER